MKKIVIIISMLSFGLFLSGCDQEVLDQVSEELCTEDPDHELCNPDALQNIEDEIVMTIAEEAFMRAKEKANKTKCRDYFSPTNVELLNQCLDEENSLIPVEYETFTATSVVSDGEFYIVTGTTTDDLEIVVVVRLIDVEGTTYIDHFEVITPGDTNADLSKADAKRALEGFIADYLDETVENSVVCPIFDGEDNDCNLYRQEDLKSGMMIEVNYLDDDDDDDGIFTAHLTITDEEGNQEEVKILVEVEFQAEEPVVKRIVTYTIDDDCDGIDDDCDGIVEDETIVKETFEQFISYYTNPMYSDEEINAMFFGGMMDADFFTERTLDLEEGITVTITDIYAIEDGWFALHLDLTIGTDRTSEQIEVRVNRIDMALVIQFDGEDNDCDSATSCSVALADAFDAYKRYLDDYMNPDITFDHLDEIYFMGMLSHDHNTTRTRLLENNAVITLVSTEYRGESLAIIDMQVSIMENGEEYTEIHSLMFYEMNGMLYFTFADDLGSDNIAEEIFEEFIVAFLQKPGDIHTLCFEYFSVESHDLCHAIVEYHISNEYYFSLFDVAFNEGGYTLTIDTFDAMGEYIETNVFDAVYHSDTNVLHLENNKEGNNPLYSIE